eukprot:CAMPEP_0170550046 /NCGR_PEP_ID=MMETSP0211-20121228/8091_1 /TAXON_ID=311385 /ORGANISM="Pseudokeronopsis sp., Strain OXSARD2" /LENGTH=111 /DNA_ID=CAMNT_0010856323 /DNA_START=810 /DNA_END=1145 /DNA_ORIENTATION=+
MNDNYLVEYSSSGMTHNCPTLEIFCEGLLDHVYANIWKDSHWVKQFNYGIIEVDKDEASTTVFMSIVDIDGGRLANKTISIRNEKHKKNEKIAEYCFHRITERRELNYYLT